MKTKKNLRKNETTENENNTEKRVLQYFGHPCSNEIPYRHRKRNREIAIQKSQNTNSTWCDLTWINRTEGDLERVQLKIL